MDIEESLRDGLIVIIETGINKDHSTGQKFEHAQCTTSLPKSGAGVVLFHSFTVQKVNLELLSFCERSAMPEF